MTPRSTSSISSKTLGALALMCLLSTWSGCLFTNAVDQNNQTTPTADMGVMDMTAPGDMSCEPPSAEDACSQMSAQCGEFDIQVCGDVYSVTCPCAQGETCTAEGTCACNEVKEPPLTCATSTSGGGCGQLTYDSGCGVLAVQDCGECPPTLVCSNNQCVEDGESCSPNTCAMQGIACGPLPQCSGDFTCGECSGTDICEAGECVPQGCPDGEQLISADELCGVEADANAICAHIYAAQCGDNTIVDCQDICTTCARSNSCSEVIVPNPGGAADQFGRTVLLRKSTLVVAAPNAHSGAGAVYLYRIRPDGTVTKTPDTVTGTQLGMAGAGGTLEALGEWLLIGAPEQGKVAAVGVNWEDTNQPTFDINTFGDAQLTPNGGNRSNSFGSALATWSDGTTHLVAVGQPLFQNGVATPGSVSVYEAEPNKPPKEWNVIHIIPMIRTTGLAVKEFGASLAFGEVYTTNTMPELLIGAPGSSNSTLRDRSGEVFVYAHGQKSGDGMWYLEESFGAPSNQHGLGQKITWAKNRLIIAAPADGSADDKLYQLLEQDTGKLTLESLSSFGSAAYFGPALASAGEGIFLSLSDKGDEGARVLVGRATQGVEVTLSPSRSSATGASDESSFGSSVSANADFVVVGAPDSDASAASRGVVYIFPTSTQP